MAYQSQFSGNQIEAAVTLVRKMGVNTDSVSDIDLDGFIYKGIATASTDPGTPTCKCFYIAHAAGTYTNFGGLVLKAGCTILKWDGSAWSADGVVNWSVVS